MRKKIRDIKQKRNGKDLIVYFLSIFGILTLCVILWISNFLQKLDYRFYDFAFRFKPEIKVNEKLVLVNADDESLKELGEWPWSREIMGDVLFRMKELGANTASFDIEYLTPSAFGVSSSADEMISEQFEASKNMVREVLSEFSGAATSGFYSATEINDLSDQLIYDYVLPAFDDTSEYIKSNIYQDNDEYFAKCIQFFKNTFLTVNNFDLKIDVLPEEKDYILKRMLDTEVIDPKNKILTDNIYSFRESNPDQTLGFTPALPNLVRRARGLGFTNSFIDSDGVRRRFEPFYVHDGHYLPSLAMAPLLYILDVHKVERKRNSYVLYNARYPGTKNRIDLKIPVDSHGRILINFRHGDIGSTFKNESILHLKQLDNSENWMFQALCGIQKLQFGFSAGSSVPYSIYEYNNYISDSLEEIIASYHEIKKEKGRLLSLCTGIDIDGNVIDGISDEEYELYFTMRRRYFEMVEEFVQGPFYENACTILENLVEIVGSDTINSIYEALTNEFNNVKDEINFTNSYLTDLKNIYDGAYCILGLTASSTTDLGATPFRKQYENVGLHASLMNTILEKDFITPLSWIWGLLISLVLFASTFIVPDKRQKLKNVYGFFVVITGILLFFVLFVFFGIYIPSVVSIIFLVCTYIFGVVYRYVSSEKEKKFITNAFSQCLAPDVVHELIANPSSFKLGGDTINMTAIFTDIQKFSAFSELLNASQLVALLNYYLTKMSDIIMDEKGTVDKYEGDAIIALVGAPKILPDHAFKACSAAIRMKKAESIMNKEILAVASKDKPENMDQNLYDAFKIMVQNKKFIVTRIGINTGEMVAGYMGSEKKKNYTMMGNNVNLASRLEGVNKAYASYILCSERSYDEANMGDNKGKIIFRRLDRVRVVNIKTPVQLYNVIGFSDEVTDDHKREIEVFHCALEKYLARDFINAGKLFLEANSIYKDDTAIIFAERCKKYIENGVTEDWDGVLNMTSK